MANRSAILGFEGGVSGASALAGSGCSIDATSKRSGDYGLHLNAASGTNGRCPVNIALSSYSVLFVRFYVQFKSFPATARYFFSENSPAAAPTAAQWGLKINPDGTVTGVAGDGTASVGPSSALSLDTWYCMEVGMDVATTVPTGINTEARVFRINGNQVGNWTAFSAGSTQTAVCFGAPDQVAATFEAYFDDIAIDRNGWPGPGRIVRLDPSALRTDHANWSNVGGASKLASISEAGVADDDTSYILSGATTGTSGEITFDFEAAGLTASQIPRAAMLFFRAVRNGGSNANITVRGKLFSAAYTQASAHQQTVITSTYTTFGAQLFASGASEQHSITMVGEQLMQDQLDNLSVGFYTSNTNGARLSKAWVEVEYDDSSRAAFDPMRYYIGSFEYDTLVEEMQTNYDITASASISSARAHTGAQSLLVKPTGGIQSHYLAMFVNTNALSSPGRGNYWTLGFWIYVQTFSASNEMLVQIVPGGSSNGGRLRLNTNGALQFDDSVDGLKTASSAGLITQGTWHHVSVEFRQASVVTTATDGYLKVWVDDVLALNHTSIKAAAVSTSLMSVRIGASTSTGAWECSIDDVIWDGGPLRPTTLNKIGVLTPDATRTAGIAFTATGAATRHEAIDELGGSDSDTTYAVVPASTTDFEQYGFSNVDAAAGKIVFAMWFARVKRDGASNATIRFTPSVGERFGAELAAAAGASYSVSAANGALSPPGRSGELTAAGMNALFMHVLAADAANASRITQLGFIYEWLERTARPRNKVIIAP